MYAIEMGSCGMLMLLMEGIYEVHIEMGSGGMIYLPSSMTVSSGI
jgi:putative component of toxin-antitoxin plasmid stabilization module